MRACACACVFSEQVSYRCIGTVRTRPKPRLRNPKLGSQKVRAHTSITTDGGLLLCIACTIKERGRGSERYSGEITGPLIYMYIHKHYVLYDFDAKD